MNYCKSKIENVFSRYLHHYQNLRGGIDGYYERTIVNATIFEVIDEKPIACFSVHKERGLTSLVVYPKYRNRYSIIFDYVIDLPLFEHVLFTEKDLLFVESIKRRGFEYQIQALNFEVKNEIESTFVMNKTTSNDYQVLQNKYGDFINYNNMKLDKITSFYYRDNDNIVCFGALEPLILNKNRYCLSMIVSEEYRKQGYGSKTIQFLISYLHKQGKEANARCYVLNEVSKKTLLRSGMEMSNYLYKCEYIKKDVL